MFKYLIILVLISHYYASTTGANIVVRPVSVIRAYVPLTERQNEPARFGMPSTSFGRFTPASILTTTTPLTTNLQTAANVNETYHDSIGEDLYKASADLKLLKKDLSVASDLLKQTNHTVHSVMLKALQAYVTSIERRVDNQLQLYAQTRVTNLKSKIAVIKEKVATLMERLKSLVPFKAQLNSNINRVDHVSNIVTNTNSSSNGNNLETIVLNKSGSDTNVDSSRTTTSVITSTMNPINVSSSTPITTTIMTDTIVSTTTPTAMMTPPSSPH